MTQLQPEDRVKVISFADAVRDHGDFTNETAELRRAVEELRSGQGTKVYDAFQKALAALSPIKGRKAIVFFTDGVDMYSESATYEQNIRAVEESGIIIYPIRYDTRADTEALVRQAAVRRRTCSACPARECRFRLRAETRASRECPAPGCRRSSCRTRMTATAIPIGTRTAACLTSVCRAAATRMSACRGACPMPAGRIRMIRGRLTRTLGPGQKTRPG
jgi:hypothetical protein